MTLIVALIAKDGIAITSDSRMTSGDANVTTTQSNDTVRKIFKVTNHCGIAIAGSGEIGVTLIEEFQRNVANENNEKLDILELSEKFRNLCITKYSLWFSRLSAESNLIPYFEVLLCGYEKNTGGDLVNPKIIKMISGLQFAPMTTTTGFATLGIFTLANYLLNRLYVRNSITTEQALSLGAFCIIETESQDGRVGGRLQAAKFSNSEIFKDLDEKEINKLTIKCDEVLRDNLKLSFYKEYQPKEEPLKAKIEGEAKPEIDAKKVEIKS